MTRSLAQFGQVLVRWLDPGSGRTSARRIRAMARGVDAGRAGHGLAAAVVALLLVLSSLSLAAGAAPTPSVAPESKVRLTAEPMLGGLVRAGEWAAVRVHLENDGPTVNGELRIASLERSASSYAVAVQLATGARQDHVIHGKAGFFGSRFTISLVSGDRIMATGKVTVDAIEDGALGVGVVAERPDRLIAGLRTAVGGQRAGRASVVAMAPEDLPERVEAWRGIDRLVWQDVSAGRLSVAQLDALKTWVALGGGLLVLGGSAGTGALDALPDELLPYRPDGIVDVPVTDLRDLLGALPGDATPLPALGGLLTRGTALGVSGERTIAARMGYGQGSVTLIGIDPSSSWLAGSPLSTALLTRAMAGSVAPVTRGAGQDDGMLVNALSYLPSVETPRMDHLFLLFLAYVVLLGPVSYLVLRRLDRREWAWVTMPALALLFTAGAFVLGVALKGSTVVVNELGVVLGAAGTDRGAANVYVGVFSPTRSAFEVGLGGGALVSQTSMDQQNGDGLVLDVLLGDPSRVRGLEVAPGAVRAFRAQAAVQTPRIDTRLALVGDHLQGTLTNASGGPLEHVTIAYAGGLQVLAAMADGETRDIDVAAGRPVTSPRDFAVRLFGQKQVDGGPSVGISTARMALIRSLWGGWGWDPSSSVDPLSGYGPVILAWRSGGLMDVDVGVEADRIGDTLFLLPVRASASGSISFAGTAVTHSLVAVDAVDGYEDASAYWLSRGTMVVAYRPGGFDGTFQPSRLLIRLAAQGTTAADKGQPVAPLAEADQPDQVDPVGTGPADTPPNAGESQPHVQLFDREAQRWVELPVLLPTVTYEVAQPARYLDASGGFLVRYVSRSANGTSPFTLAVRLDGTVQ